MSFEQGLLSSDYIYDPQVGSFMKEESNGNLHTYMEIDDNIWSYELYDQDDNVLMTKEFNLD